MRSSQQILQDIELGQDRPGQTGGLTHLTNSSTFSPGSHAGHTIAGFGLGLFTFVIVQVQVSKVNDVIILILKADFLTQTPGNGIIKV